MTCIVGLADGEHVWMGSDSLGTSSCFSTDLKTPKLFRIGRMLIGYSTAYRFGQILQYHVSPPKFDPVEDPLEYVVRQFVPSLRTALKEHGWNEVEDGIERGGMFLLAIGERLFNVQNDHSVLEDLDGYSAIGCGRAFAMGSMFSTAGINSEARVMVALEAAAKLDEHVSGPFTVERA